MLVLVLVLSIDWECFDTYNLIYLIRCYGFVLRIGVVVVVCVCVRDDERWAEAAVSGSRGILRLQFTYSRPASTNRGLKNWSPREQNMESW